MYEFTTTLPNQVCRLCGKTFSNEWSSGGVGATCKQCYSKVSILDLVELGIIKNIEIDNTQDLKPSYKFEVRIDGEWHKCSRPCGDWSYVDDGCVFSVPVGWYTLQQLYRKHFRKKDDLIEKVEEQHREICQLLREKHYYKCAYRQIFYGDRCTCGRRGGNYVGQF